MIIVPLTTIMHQVEEGAGVPTEGLVNKEEVEGAKASQDIGSGS